MNLKPGRKLDKLIAEKIFNLVPCDGWEPVSFGSAGGMFLQKMCYHKEGECWPNKTVSNMSGVIGDVPKYSTMFSHTKILLDKMLEVIPQQDFHIEHHEGSGWQVSTCYEEECWKGWVQGETIEHAICLAAVELFKVEY